jgi:hypothetical protein
MKPEPTPYSSDNSLTPAPLDQCGRQFLHALEEPVVDGDLAADLAIREHVPPASGR